MERVDLYLLLGRYIRLNLGTMLHLSAEAHSGHSQAQKINLFARIVNSFILKLLTICVKRFIVDVFRGPEYVSDLL